MMLPQSARLVRLYIAHTQAHKTQNLALQLMDIAKFAEVLKMVN